MVNNWRLLIIVIAGFLLFTYQVEAVDVSGDVSTYLEKNDDYYTALSELKLKVDAGNFKYSGHLDGSILFEDNKFLDLGDLSPDSEFKLNQIYLNIWLPYGEIIIGKQRIAWGSGYFFNPTDIVNPPKEKPNGDINPRQSTESLHGTYYLGNDTLEGVVTTEYQPLGPEDDREATVLAGKIKSGFKGEVQIPDDFTGESEYALRYSTLVKNYDFSLLYYHGREDYPVQRLNPLTGTVTFFYPEKSTFGIEMAGTIGSIGVWGEAAYTDPEMGDNYLQSIAGLDYTFKNGFHLLGEYYRDESFSNFIPGEIKTNDFIGLEVDYNLTDLLKVTGSYLTPLEEDCYLTNLKFNYSLAQDVELKAGLNEVRNEAGTIFTGDSSLISVRDNIYLELIYYY